MKDAQTALVLEPQQEAALQPMTPMGMIQLALRQNAPVEVLRDLFKLKQEVEADEARKAFLKAFAAFKAEAVIITKNIAVTAGPLSGKRYADLYAVVSVITPALSKHGLSMSWKLSKDEPQWIEVTCTVRHEQGHSESVSMGGPPDAGGAKNAIQARASSKTYLERYTALAITGMAAQGEDVDGNGKSDKPHIADERFVECREWIRNATTLAEVKRLYTLAYAEAERIGDSTSMLAYVKVRDERATQLRRDGQQ